MSKRLVGSVMLSEWQMGTALFLGGLTGAYICAQEAKELLEAEGFQVDVEEYGCNAYMITGVKRDAAVHT